MKGGILATFDVRGEKFNAWVINTNTIEQILNLRDGISRASIPSSPVLKNSGEWNHNAPWSWHMDPEKIVMTDFAMELCDGLPSYVEANLDNWINEVKRFCPWSAKLIDVQDFR